MRIALTLALLLGVLASLFFSASGASAAVYAAGTWNIDLLPDPFPGCTAEIGQEAGVLTFDFSCSPLVPGGTPPSGSGTGVIDELTGQFSVSGTWPVPAGIFSFDGTIAPDGDSMSGNWLFGSSGIIVNGTFTGTRKTTFTPTSTPMATLTPTATSTLPPSVGGVSVSAVSATDGDATVGLGFGLTAALVLAGAAWIAARGNAP